MNQLPTLGSQLARHVRAYYFGPSAPGPSLQSVISDVDWEMANQKTNGFNTIALLVFHSHYYTMGVGNVLDGGRLEIRDKYSFDMPPINGQAEWEAFLAKIWEEAEAFARKVEQLPDAQFYTVFEQERYGNYYQNVRGIIEHAFYHLGQIVLLKKLLKATKL